ncbi:hypothetical protein Nepgr_021356 [Nepenthes gracilis]|uniref:Alpha 1,4-glycosyltransferase domain-containing protein n=1 Tax=Nepenthes gracilis TaxID=150966 RepID=A0AAD3XX53_NEPGR|nr:hypothetical protein Nepgr_021356 [Nepenthes gracilis]
MEKNTIRGDFTVADCNYFSKLQFSVFRRHFQKRALLSSFCCLPTSLLALALVLLLAYSAVSVFYLYVQFPVRISSEPVVFFPGNVRENARKWTSSSVNLSSNVIYAVEEESSAVISRTTRLHLLHDFDNFSLPFGYSSDFPSRMGRRKKRVIEIPHLQANRSRFSSRVKRFFSNYSCELRFFMTWISSLESFTDRELFTMESLFNSHPDACLLIVSNSMDSSRGKQILSRFFDNNFRLMAISPDYDYLFKNTMAARWFDQLRKGEISPGKVSLGQNLSNLLRLSLIYKFGGIYMDTDFIVLKKFSSLRNVIGAQNLDCKTGNWSRLNNAVMIFDKKHPLLRKFIQEFSLTFDGDKWGHNGPYLVSRVVKRISGRSEYNFTVLPPSAFYPVGWRRISRLLERPREEFPSKWLGSKVEEIRSQSFAIHMWNRKSRSIKIEEGSLVSHLMLDFCIFCNL